MSLAESLEGLRKVDLADLDLNNLVSNNTAFIIQGYVRTLIT